MNGRVCSSVLLFFYFQAGQGLFNRPGLILFVCFVAAMNTFESVLNHFRAIKNGKGLHSKKEVPIHRVADISGVSVCVLFQLIV